MLKSETLNMIEFNNGQTKKPILIKYTIIVNSNESQPYDEAALKLIGFFKSLPEVYESVELYYTVADAKITHLHRQSITIKVDRATYSTYVLDDDLDMFFQLLRLFKRYEYYVEGYEQSVAPAKIAQVIASHDNIEIN